MSFSKQEKNNVVFHTADGLSAAGGVAHGFSTKLGGVSVGDCAGLNLGLSRGDDPAAVRENYRLFCTAVGTNPQTVVKSRQVHTDNVRVVTQADVQELYASLDYEADALVTDVPGIALTVYYADCIPILLYDPVRAVVSAVHSGWRGTALGIVERAVEKMVHMYGSQPKDIRAAIGPGICPCCFETHADVPEAFLEAMGNVVRPFLIALPNGKFQVDLKGINAFRLQRAGLTQIEVLPLCTACHPELYWSHRKIGERRGNQAAMIALLARHSI